MRELTLVVGIVEVALRPKLARMACTLSWERSKLVFGATWVELVGDPDAGVCSKPGEGRSMGMFEVPSSMTPLPLASFVCWSEGCLS